MGFEQAFDQFYLVVIQYKSTIHSLVHNLIDSFIHPTFMIIYYWKGAKNEGIQYINKTVSSGKVYGFILGRA